MKAIHFKVILIFACRLPSILASIPSFGQRTNGEIRNELMDSDFKIDVRDGILVQRPNLKIFIAEQSRFPALAGQDVQSMIVRAFVRSGATFFPHYHPRGAEVFTVLRGSFNVTLTFEGLEPRKVMNTINAGECTIYPVGLVHETTCISRQTCIFMGVFTSADPGTVPI